MIVSGIYQIISKASQNFYIGSSMNIDKRLREHRNALKRGAHHSHILQRSFSKYGMGGFEFKTLIICEPKDLLMYEQRTLDILQPKYNISKNAGSAAGIKRRPETIQKLIDSWAARGPSEAQLRHMQDLAIARTGKKRPPMTEAQKEKLRAANLGKKQSEETKAKKSLATKGLKKTEEHKAKIAAAMTGKKRAPFSAEWIEKLRLSSTGRKHRPESIEKMKIAMTLSHQKRKLNA